MAKLPDKPEREDILETVESKWSMGLEAVARIIALAVRYRASSHMDRSREPANSNLLLQRAFGGEDAAFAELPRN